MVLLSNSEVYNLVTDMNESELERWIINNIDYVFGEDVLYFDVKKRIESIIGTKTIPDGYLIRLSEPPIFMVIEYELSNHDPYRHTLPQLRKFDVSVKNFDTQRKLAKLFYDNLIEDEKKLEKIKRHLGEEEIFLFILSCMQLEPHYLILLDEVIEEYDELEDAFPSNTVIEYFKTYSNNSGDIIHEFSPVFKKIDQYRSLTSEDRKKLDQRIRSMFRNYQKKHTNAWRSFPPNLRDSLEIRGVELVKNRNNNKVVLLAYLNSSMLKSSLVDKGYTECFSDHSDGDWFAHKESPNSYTHPVLLKTTKENLELDNIKTSIYQLVNDVINN